MTDYNVHYYLKKFWAIPDSKWTEGAFHREDSCCALGHCGGNESLESKTLNRLFRGSVFPTYNPMIEILPTADINDGCTALSKRADLQTVFNYKDLGDTPKERVINALLLVEAGLWDEAHGVTTK